MQTSYILEVIRFQKSPEIFAKYKKNSSVLCYFTKNFPSTIRTNQVIHYFWDKIFVKLQYYAGNILSIISPQKYSEQTEPGNIF